MTFGIARRGFMQTVASTALLMTGRAAWAGQGVTPARLSGPIPVTPQSGEPFRGDNDVPIPGSGLPPPALVPYDYVEEEYFVSGAVDGRPYRTSLLVRKPRDPARFSGLVAVETIHADGAVPFWGTRDVWMSGGHGWAAVASQLGALEGHVRKSNPRRYASLVLPDAGDGVPARGSRAELDGGRQDLVSQAIMTQVGALLKRNDTQGPFRGMTVRRLAMGGVSQTGGTTLRYIEGSHAAARLPDGRPIYDGYFPSEALPERPVPPTDAVILHPVTECDLLFTRALGRPYALRPDSDAPGDRYRHYQFTGDSHVGTRGITDLSVLSPTLKGVLHPGEHLSQFPATELMSAATHNFIDWLMRGVSPPKAAPIEGAAGEIVRDQLGVAKGGVRSPYVDTPTVRYIASAPVAPGETHFRQLIGLEEPFAADRLRTLYGTRANYLARFDRGIDQMAAGRWLLPKDAEKLKAQEAQRALF
jgi:hypothetical protein